MSKLLICLCLAAVVCSCGGKQPKGTVLATGKMQEVMWDMFLADAFTDKYLKTDSSKKELAQSAALQKKIFELHKISKEDFYVSYDYYNNHPDLMRIMLDSISAKGERERGGIMTERFSGGSRTRESLRGRSDSARRAHAEKD